MGKLIIIEGSDGSGKQTQTEKLYNYLSEKYKAYKISFPNYNSDSSALVKMYLNGDFGKNPEDVNPYISSLFYSVDRYASYKTDFGKKYIDDYLVISDRYTTSNMIHQASKIENRDERYKFLSWLEDLEYNKIGLPKPDLVIFLNVSISKSLELMEKRNNKITNEEKKDIHEINTKYLTNCYNNALDIAKYKKWIIIDCIKDNKMKSIEEIHKEIVVVVKRLLND